MSTDNDLRILLVEDDEDDYVLTADLLTAIEGKRYRLDWAQSADAALEVIAGGAHDLLLVDFMLGERSGIEVLERAVERGFGGPILMLTGASDRETDLKAMRAGAADFLVKSELSASSLERAIRYAMERHVLLRELAGFSSALQQRELLLRRVTEQSVAGILVLDQHGEVRFANPVAARFFGRSEAELAGTRLEIPLETGAREIPILVDSDAPGIAELRCVEIEWQGERAWLANLLDITRRKRAEEKLVRQANRDELTGLANRTMFYEFLSRALSRAQRNERSLAVLFLDLDHFKQINDRLGHDAGDALLRGFAQRLRSCLRGEDLVARLGGDEFAVVIDDVRKSQHSGRVADKIVEALAEPFSLGGEEVHARSSIGIATYPGDGTDAGSLVKAADTAMYEAKRMGRNNYQYFAAQMQEAAVMRSILEYDLNHALRNDQLELYYQPKVSAHSWKVVGVEALLRWHHDRRGLLAPDQFISVAEDSGIIVPLGEWVIQRACADVRRLREMGLETPFSIAVNVSLRQMKRRALASELLAAVAAAGVQPCDIEVELTETTLMDDPQTTIANLRQLHDAGIRIAIDDFGTGYSSLQYLRRLPIDQLKIDRSFTRDIGTDADGEIIVHTTINLAHNLGLKVVAEGVETAEQALYLQERGCDTFQGYYFGKPMTLADLQARVLDRERSPYGRRDLLSREPPALPAVPSTPGTG